MVKKLEISFREITREAIDAVAKRGQCDFVRDIAVWPRVAQKAVELSLDLWREGEAADCRVVFEVAPASTPEQTVKRFEHACRLSATESPTRDLTGKTRRVQCTFPWPEARPSAWRTSFSR